MKVGSCSRRCGLSPLLSAVEAHGGLHWAKSDGKGAFVCGAEELDGGAVMWMSVDFSDGVAQVGFNGRPWNKCCVVMGGNMYLAVCACRGTRQVDEGPLLPGGAQQNVAVVHPECTELGKALCVKLVECVVNGS